MNAPFPLPARYRPNNKLFKGGQSSVQICLDKFLDRQVAVKMLRSSGSLTSLRDELRIISEIRSKHVVDLYDTILAADGSSVMGLVEEYVPGPTLAEAIQANQGLDFYNVLWQICCGVSDIHKHGKIHRDLKPENLKFDSEGVLKILDFGLSMDAAGAATLHSRGSHYYAGPELFDVPPISISAALDVYSIGVLAWFVANNGVLPSFLWDFRRKALTQPLSIASIVSGISPQLANRLDLSLSLDATMRPTANDLRESFSAELLKGKHRAQITLRNQKHFIDKIGQGVKLSSGSDSVVVMYNGFNFTAVQCAGDVFLNNAILNDEDILPNSCVITLGRPELGAQRLFVPIDMSHPEVTL